MLLSAVSVLVVAQSSSEIPEGLMNNPVYVGCNETLYIKGLTYLLTYLLTPLSRVLLEKLTSKFPASQEIPRIYGTRKSLTVPTSARHPSLS